MEKLSLFQSMAAKWPAALGNGRPGMRLSPAEDANRIQNPDRENVFRFERGSGMQFTDNGKIDPDAADNYPRRN